MQPHVVTAIVCQNGTAASGSSPKDVGIRRAPGGQTSLACRQHVVAKLAELANHSQREILVGEERDHSLRRLVLVYQAVDLVTVCPRVGPGIYQVFST